MSCSPNRFPIRAGDLLPILVTQATFVDPADGRSKPMDFTGWTGITFKMTGPRTIVAAASGDNLGTLSYAWVSGDTNAPGLYKGWFFGVSPEGKPQTFPTVGGLEIEIGRL